MILLHTESLEVLYRYQPMANSRLLQSVPLLSSPSTKPEIYLLNLFKTAVNPTFF